MDFSTGSDRDRIKRDTGGESGLVDWASIVHSGFRHHLTKLLEQVSAIMRTGRGFRVILDAKRGEFAVT